MLLSSLLLIFSVSAFDHLLEINGTCEISNDITHFGWNELSEDIDNKPFINYSLSVNEDSLTLFIDLELEYLGWAYADHTPGYGVTYVLDFEDYDAEQDDIREPGTCQNRLAANFTDPPYEFPGLWNYSATPQGIGHLGEFPYSAYP
eukprot:588140_1